MIRPQTSPSGPLSRRFDVASVRDGALRVPVEATPAECAALAQDCDLPGIETLTADLRVVREGPTGLHVTGSVKARIRQVCVVSLDDFASDLTEAVDVRFAPEAEVETLQAERAASSVQDDDALGDLPDPIVNGRIDLGSLVAEVLVLGLDPYPRKPGVAFADPTAAAPEAPEASPFAVLRGLGQGDEG